MKTPSKPMRPAAFDFLDYREYLKQVFEFSKRAQRGFSFRKFALQAGFSSPNFLKLVYDGQRNLSIESAHKIARAFKLNKSETAFFQDLVLYNQAKDADSKSYFFQRLMKHSSHAPSKVQIMNREQFDYYSQWTHVALRELVDTASFREDPEWISNRLKGALSASEVPTALERLRGLGLIERTTAKKWRVKETQISTPSEVRSNAVFNFQKEMIEKALESLKAISAENRDISSSTFAISRDLMPEAKKRIAAFRRQFLDWAEKASENRTDVYQLNLQLFPLTDLPNQEGR